MERQYDLVVTGGTIYTPQGPVAGGQLCVAGEKIAAINSVPDRSIVAAKEIDASGLLVLPGVIDTHSHHRDPGFTYKEDITTATSAAALGGVTTSVGMPNVDPPTVTPERYAALIESQQERAIVDFNHNPAPTRTEHVPELSQMGALGFKVYMVVDSKRSYPHMPGLGIHDHAHLHRIFEAVASSGRVLMVHPNDQALLHVLEERAWAGGDFSFRNYAYTEAGQGGVVWNVAVAVLLELQRATSAPLHVLHMMNPGMIDLVAHAKERGGNVTSEVNPFALFLSDLDTISHLGPFALGRCIPKAWVESLYEAIRNGTIDVLGSDHAPHSIAEKEIGWENMWKAPSGTPQLQHYLPRLLTETKTGHLSIEDVVRITATNPARRFGLYPKKGVLAVGADADMAMVDMTNPVAIHNADVLSRAGYTPYDGQELVGVPRFTTVRGQVVAADGAITVSPGYGNFTPPVGPPEDLAKLRADPTAATAGGEFHRS